MRDIEADVNFLKLKMEVEKEETLSIRDQFAMAALTGMLSNPVTQEITGKTIKTAWQVADFMMEARK
jgi:hypothetical protein